MEHNCTLFRCNFTNENKEVRTILVAANPSTIKTKSLEVLGGLIERGALEPGDWKLTSHNEIFAYVATPGAEFAIYQPVTTAVGR